MSVFADASAGWPEREPANPEASPPSELSAWLDNVLALPASGMDEHQVVVAVAEGRDDLRL